MVSAKLKWVQHKKRESGVCTWLTRVAAFSGYVKRDKGQTLPLSIAW